MKNIQNFNQFINEDNLLLRKLNFKSIIGFGNYKDLTVQDLINLQREMELVQIYYSLAKIDFVDEVKKELCIDEKRSIKKPGIDKTALKFFRKDILHDIITKKKEKGEHKPSARYREITAKKKDIEIKNTIKRNTQRLISYGSGKK